VGVNGLSVLALLDNADCIGHLDVSRHVVADDAVLRAGGGGQPLEAVEGSLAAVGSTASITIIRSVSGRASKSGR